jgi:phosphatidylserine/phosphatidylglycerophosphate/cardiolipin synthase-like enzyme
MLTSGVVEVGCVHLSNQKHGRSDRHDRFHEPRAAEWNILRPGRNCWRVRNCRRAAVLIDGASYFSRLETTLRQARKSILILGWDFDGSIRLRPDVGSDESPPLGPFLHSLLEERPELEIRILVWSLATVHAPSAPMPLLLGTDWQNHPRLHVRLDTHHPIYAAHHQKIVCIDDALAFVGGMDLTVRRWDTARHAAGDPVRISPDARPYDPVHDIQMMVDGEIVGDIASLARRRWAAATGEELAPVTPEAELWPSDLPPDFTEMPLAIARTMPAWGGQPAVGEVAALTADALAAARQAIYIEAQYMTAPYVGDILAAQLDRPDGPEIVVVMTHESHGLAERIVMGNNRDRLIRRLRQADRHDRLRVSFPCVPAGNGERRQVLVHSKLIIVDDTFLRIGSSNLNNRSIGLDTECDLAVEARRIEARRTIVLLRNRLLAEHLDTDPETVAGLAEENGSLVRAVDALNHKPRGLRPFEAMYTDGPSRPALGTRLLDPKRPFAPLRFLRGSRSWLP